MQTLKDAIKISQEYDEGKHDFTTPAHLIHFAKGLFGRAARQMVQVSA